jgi:ribonuclease P protein component
MGGGDETGRARAEPAATGASRPDFSLGRDRRIASPVVFRQVFDGGRNAVGRYMVMWVRGGTGTPLRLGVVATRRTFRRSVDRSRAKRLLREAFRLNHHRLRDEGDLVLVGRRRILDADRATVERDFVHLADKLGLRAAEADPGTGER